MKKLIQAQIDEGEKVETVSSKVFKKSQEIYVHLKIDTIKCRECGKENNINSRVRYYPYKNLADFLNDREILEGMIE